jgi:hypothetical protein
MSYSLRKKTMMKNGLRDPAKPRNRRLKSLILAGASASHHAVRTNDERVDAFLDKIAERMTSVEAYTAGSIAGPKPSKEDIKEALWQDLDHYVQYFVPDGVLALDVQYMVS